MIKLVVSANLLVAISAQLVGDVYYPAEIGYGGYPVGAYVNPVGYGGYGGKYIGEPLVTPQEYSRKLYYHPMAYGPRGGYSGGEQFIGGPGYPYHGDVYENLERNKNLLIKQHYNDGEYDRSKGKTSEQVVQGQEGYHQGHVGVKEGQGQSEYYSDVKGGKKLEEEGKTYHGGQHYDQEGKNGEEKKLQQGHKKGHFVKGFKTSHHKDESGKTEEYYDEANDEGDHFNFNGQTGSFGNNGGSSYKGGHKNDEINDKLHKSEGYYDNQHIVDKSDSNHGKVGEDKYARTGIMYARDSGVAKESLLNEQENNNSPYVEHFYRH